MVIDSTMKTGGACLLGHAPSFVCDISNFKVVRRHPTLIPNVQWLLP